MSDRPRISVIIPVYRDNEGLARCLEGLRRQQLPAEQFEVIAVNNDPGTPLEVSGAGDLRLRVVEEAAPGSYAARNAGIREARGGILAFTDADCIPDETWLSAGSRLLEEGGAELVAGEVRFFFEGERPNACEYLDAATKINQEAYAEVGFGATANLFVLREVIEACGPFDAGLQSGGDYEFGRRATAAGFRIVYSREARVRHPARSSFRAMMRKSARVARGQKQLEAQGKLEHGRLGLRSLVPLIRIPEAEVSWDPPLAERLKMVAIMNLRKYLNIWIRWFG